MAVQRELTKFFKHINPSQEYFEVKKAAFCRVRKKIHEDAFKHMAFLIPEKYYDLVDTSVWKGFRLFAVDGSTVELPNSKEIVEQFGIFKTREDGRTARMARILSIHDVCSNLIVAAKMNTIHLSETQMLWEM